MVGVDGNDAVEGEEADDIAWPGESGGEGEVGGGRSRVV